VAGLPIGKAVDVWADEKGLLAHTRFAVDQPEPVGSWATLLYSLLRDGMIKGWSVMFDPWEWVEPDGTEVKRKRGSGWWGPNPGRTYKRMELMEYGPVFVPANPEAATVVAKSLDGLRERGVWTPPGMVTEPGFSEMRRALQEQAAEKIQAGAGGVEPAVGGAEAEEAAREHREEIERCVLRADGAALGLRVRGALSQIRRANDRMRSPLRRSDR
jgi:hypothetical protein